MEKLMRDVHLHLVFATTVLLAPSFLLRAQTAPLVRVQSGGNPLLGRWVSADLSQSSMIFVKRTEMIFNRNYTVTGISYKTDGTTLRVINRYGISPTDRPDEGYLWLFSNRMGLEANRRYEFKLYNGLLYLQSRETGLMIFKKKGR